MLRALLLTLFISVITVSITLSSAVMAADKQSNKQITSSKQAAEVVKQRYGGTVLKVNKQKGKAAYKVKIVKPNGQVVSKSVNANTGKIERD